VDGVGVGDVGVIGVGCGESVVVATGAGEEESVATGVDVSDAVGVAVVLASTEGDALASAVGELLVDGVGVDVVSASAIDACDKTETVRRSVANVRFQSRRMKPPVAPTRRCYRVSHCVGFATDSSRTRRPIYGSRIVVPLS
jgi:hypothetical protein